MLPRFAAAFDLLAIINTVDLSHRQVFVILDQLHYRGGPTLYLHKDTKYS
jgi:hypothetical protein